MTQIECCWCVGAAAVKTTHERNERQAEHSSAASYVLSAQRECGVGRVAACANRSESEHFILLPIERFIMTAWPFQFDVIVFQVPGIHTRERVRLRECTVLCL